MKAVITFMMLLFCVSASSKDLGVSGSTFPIQEQNILEWILAKLHKMEVSGELEQFQEKFKEKAIESVMRPKPVHGISHTTENKEFLYDPSITLSETILTHDGKTVHPKGTTINPLDTAKFTDTFLFIDGDALEQVEWAISHPAARKKIILINGAIIDLMRQHGVRLYFDQAGKLTSKFGITHVPAQITQFGKRLKIKEVAL